MKEYTLHFYSQDGSSITHLVIDSKSKARALRMGKEIAQIIFDYYQSGGMPWIKKISVKAEEYRLNIK